MKLHHSFNLPSLPEHTPEFQVSRVFQLFLVLYENEWKPTAAWKNTQKNSILPTSIRFPLFVNAEVKILGTLSMFQVSLLLLDIIQSSMEINGCVERYEKTLKNKT